MNTSTPSPSPLPFPFPFPGWTRRPRVPLHNRYFGPTRFQRTNGGGTAPRRRLAIVRMGVACAGEQHVKSRLHWTREPFYRTWWGTAASVLHGKNMSRVSQIDGPTVSSFLLPPLPSRCSSPTLVFYDGGASPLEWRPTSVAVFFLCINNNNNASLILLSCPEESRYLVFCAVSVIVGCSVYSILLLVLCGDVELNPGPRNYPGTI